MRIYIVGISCVGKSSIGESLAKKMNYKFIDFDKEVEYQMEEFISTIKNRHFNEHGYRDEVKHILTNILNKYIDNIVISMPPGGMFGQYLRILNKNPDILTITLKDTAKNILKRLVFYTDETKLIEEKVVNDSNRDAYYKSVKDDIEYFYTTHKKAKMKFNINGRNIEESSEALFLQIKDYLKNT